jgi:cytoskeletal protein CcmA (bactofilin family)
MKFGSSTEARPRPGEMTGFIGEGVELLGEITFKDTLRIDGKVRARINSDGELVVGPTGEVEGEITVGAATVSGRIRGTLRVMERLEVHGGGRVEGDVLLGRPGLVVHDGGIVEARVQMGTIREGDASPEGGAGSPARTTAGAV